ncbi:putative protein kinase RLK-Pelle-LRR-XII-1 family [Helianthus annuus]|nr:putative protein kinase RLK-Pelle-LRR-XII-1 family [Helianthus annuus]
MLFPLLSKLASVIVVALVIHMIGAVYGSSAESDHLALLEIKSKITDDPQGALTSWNDSLPFCQWTGVTCGRRHQRVTMLKLRGLGLVGSLSPYIGNMSFLGYIYLGSNQLHGSIPPEISHLHRLRSVSLSNNSFSGEIPANMFNCSKLSFIKLRFNKLSGKIPNAFSSKSMITVLALGRNHLIGGIPPSVGNLTSLEELTLGDNQLEGSIPDSFIQLKNLRKIGLGLNSLVGAFPSFMFNLSRIEILSFTGNQLQGSLPSNLCLSQPHLTLIELGGNHFNGFLPPSISNCSDVEILDFCFNYLKGEIGIDFGRLQHLRGLSLADNNFGSKNLDDMIFFSSLSNCTNLEMMDIGDNQLGGVLPYSFGNFSSKLSFLRMAFNYLSGNIPSSIRNLLGLTTINLNGNRFTGMIPESIGKLQNLQKLYLYDNHFSGVIPRSIGNLSLLTKVTLAENSLEGSIPSTIGSWKNVIVLDLHGNKLSGSVPKELFQLSPLSIGLDLSQNNLSGVLPQEIGNLKLLGILDFSMNRFTGNIPSYLQQIPLKHLNLSYNNFEGEVPVKGVFANTSAISIIGNAKLCGGILDLHLPRCTGKANDDKRRTRKPSIRVIVAVSLCSTVAGLGLLSFVLFYCCIKKKRDKPSELRLAESFEKISYGRLFKATEGFSTENLIGIGSFASVYKGVFDENGFTMAIKVLNLQRRGGFKSFMAECEALRNIRHRNLVKVITACSSIDFQGNDFKALVYDFMPNGNLESWLHSVDRTLDLVQRISIIKDVACALDYLHCRCGNVIVHCDLKPSNILLDADMVAHVGDFGLAKILSLEEGSYANASSSSIIRGTVGYAPPEYGLGNEVSTSGDMYSYGILLLEMLTVKKPVDPMFEGGLGLHSYARRALADGCVLKIVDPVLLSEDVNENCLISLVKVGVQCSNESPQDRMDIGTVIHELFGTPFANRS